MENVKCNAYCRDFNFRDGKNFCTRYDCEIKNSMRCKECVEKYNKRRANK